MNELTLSAIRILLSVLSFMGTCTCVILMIHYHREAERLKKKLEFIKKHYDLEDAEFIFESSEFDD